MSKRSFVFPKFWPSQLWQPKSFPLTFQAEKFQKKHTTVFEFWQRPNVSSTTTVPTEHKHDVSYAVSEGHQLTTERHHTFKQCRVALNNHWCPAVWYLLVFFLTAQLAYLTTIQSIYLAKFFKPAGQAITDLAKSVSLNVNRLDRRVKVCKTSSPDPDYATLCGKDQVKIKYENAGRNVRGDRLDHTVNVVLPGFQHWHDFSLGLTPIQHQM